MMSRIIRSTAGHADVGGAHLYYEVAGAGHPLVLVHASLADSRMWDDQFPVFAQHYRVIRYDMRGFGSSYSKRPSGPYTHHGDLAALLRHLDVEQAYLVGASLGGRVALEFTLTHPERVAALILVAAGLPGHPWSKLVREAWEDEEAALRRGDLGRAIEINLRLWVDGPQRTPEQVDPAVRRRVGELIRHGLMLTADQTDEQPLEPPAADRLAQVRAPTLVIRGAHDVPDVAALADRLAVGITGARKVVIPRGAHLVNMEQPAVFNQVLHGFLSVLGGAGQMKVVLPNI